MRGGDETGCLKPGDPSAGGQRQDSGTAGRFENCQVGVFLAQASPQGRTCRDHAWSRPKEGAAAPARRQEASIPASVSLATRPQLAQRMRQHACDAGAPAAGVTADEGSGSDGKRRLWLEGRGPADVLALKSEQRVGGGCRPAKGSVLAAAVPADAGPRLRGGDGARGPRRYAGAVTRPTCPEPEALQRWLLVRRSTSDPTDRAW